MPLLAVLALVVLALSNLRGAAASPGLLAAVQATPAAVLQSVAAPLLLAAGLLFVVMKNGKYLCDRPNLLPDVAVPWH